MNTDLNTAASQSYELAQQLVNHYTSYGSQSEPVVVYAKEFYEYLISDIPYDFDALSQSLKTVVGRICAQMSAQYCRHNDENNSKILKAAKNMESSMRSSGQYYSSLKMSIKLEPFAVKCLSPQEIVNQSFNELDQYASFVKMAISNDWSEDPHFNLVKIIDELSKEMDEGLQAFSVVQDAKIKQMEIEMKKNRLNSFSTLPKKLAEQLEKRKLNAYNEAYWDFHDEPDDLYAQNAPLQRKPKL